MMRGNKQTKAVTCLFAAAILLAGLSISPCLADIWMDPGDLVSDTLTVGAGEIIAGNGWNFDGTSFFYSVYRPLNESAPLHYFYAFTVGSGGIGALSHLIIEVSDAVEGGLPAFDLDNPMDYSNGPTAEVGSYAPNGDNPGMPLSGIFGIKFEDMFDEDATTWTVGFDSYRLPMWGDFYAKDGQHEGEWAYAYNSDFGYPYDATDHPNKILVPDSAYVPVPAAVLLGMLGLGVVGLKLRKYA